MVVSHYGYARGYDWSHLHIILSSDLNELLIAKKDAFIIYVFSSIAYVSTEFVRVYVYVPE